MNIWLLILLVALFGAIGGLANCAIAGEFVLPHADRVNRIWRPGWVGNVVVGAVAAVFIWGTNGPLASHDILSSTIAENAHLTLAQLLSSIVVGLGGGNILTQFAQKNAERVAKENLTRAVETAATAET